MIRRHVIPYQTKKQYKFSVCILYPVCSQQSAFFNDRIGIAVFVRASLKSGPKYWGSKRNFSETILAAMIDVWTVCWRAPEEKHNDGALITLYRLKTNANARLTNIAASDALLRGHSLWTLRFLDSSCIYGSSEMWLEIIICNKPYKHFISFHVSFWASSKLILTFTKWGGVACETTSVHGSQYNFRLWNTTSVHGLKLPSTWLHHNTSFNFLLPGKIKTCSPLSPFQTTRLP